MTNVVVVDKTIRRVTGFIWGSGAACLAFFGDWSPSLLGGLIWDNLDPACVFLIPMVVDLLFKIPLLTTIPETLSKAAKEEADGWNDPPHV